MDALTFDLTSMFTGADFPTEEFPIFVNERIAYEIAAVDAKIAADPDNESLEEKRAEILKEAEKFCFRIRITGVPKDQYIAVGEEIQERFPSEFNSFGRLKPNKDREEALESSLWALYITSITAPDGSVGEGITPEEATEMRRRLPSAATDKIASKISEMAALTRKGFEGLAQEIDFLSQR